jgi:hypothetical protein
MSYNYLFLTEKAYLDSKFVKNVEIKIRFVVFIEVRFGIIDETSPYPLLGKEGAPTTFPLPASLQGGGKRGWVRVCEYGISPFYSEYFSLRFLIGGRLQIGSNYNQ